MPLDVQDAVFNVVHDYKPGGAAGLARSIDYNPTTLSHEAKGTGTAKIGLLTAVKITQYTGDPRILNAFAGACGYVVTPLPYGLAVDGGLALQLVSRLADEFNDVFQCFIAAASDNRFTGNELTELRRQRAELEVAVQRILAYAEAMHEDGKPAHLRAA